MREFLGPKRRRNMPTQRSFTKKTVSTSFPAAPQPGDEWLDPSSNRYYKYMIYAGADARWVEFVQPVTSVSVAGSDIARRQMFGFRMIFG